ncbi:MAG: hypothetical protein K9K79_02825 [Desulfohalobiaceae bacterium]|nr:hypothetical protein [Desulfohalobiaceae bacterium]
MLAKETDWPWPPPGESQKIEISRDTLVSTVGGERIGSNGVAGRLKVKGQQEYVLFDIDSKALKGKIIAGALLHLRSDSPDRAPLGRVGVSTLSSRWREGRSSHYLSEVGSSCFEQAFYRHQNWTVPGSTLMEACFGRGQTIWKFADCSAPDEQNWQTCAVEPDVVAARVAGLSHGFVLADEIGQEWACPEGVFEYTWLPNRHFKSTESWNSAPWLQVWTKGADHEPPEGITGLEVVTRGLKAGEALIGWRTPRDLGGGSTLGYRVRVRSKDHEVEVPKYQIPMAGEPGQEVWMHLRDLRFSGGEEVEVSIAPVDSAGNTGAALSRKITLAREKQLPDLPVVQEFCQQTPKTTTDLPQVGGVNVSVIDVLDKMDPISGNVIPEKSSGYMTENHLFSGKRKQIHLFSASNEMIHFQIVFNRQEGGASDARIECNFAQAEGIRTRFYDCRPVKIGSSGNGLPYLPDPLTELQGDASISLKAKSVSSRGERFRSLLCEFYVPHKVSPGKKRVRSLFKPDMRGLSSNLS